MAQSRLSLARLVQNFEPDVWREPHANLAESVQPVANRGYDSKSFGLKKHTKGSCLGDAESIGFHTRGQVIEDDRRFRIAESQRKYGNLAGIEACLVDPEVVRGVSTT